MSFFTQPIMFHSLIKWQDLALIKLTTLIYINWIQDESRLLKKQRIHNSPRNVSAPCPPDGTIVPLQEVKPVSPVLELINVRTLLVSHLPTSETMACLQQTLSTEPLKPLKSSVNRIFSHAYSWALSACLDQHTCFSFIYKAISVKQVTFED